MKLRRQILLIKCSSVQCKELGLKTIKMRIGIKTSFTILKDKCTGISRSIKGAMSNQITHANS